MTNPKRCPFCGAAHFNNFVHHSAFASIPKTQCLSCYGEAPTSVWNTRATGWMPLADAPLHKDGFLYIEGVADLNVHSIVHGRILDGCVKGRFGTSPEASGVTFTHWMPEPDPPAA